MKSDQSAFKLLMVVLCLCTPVNVISHAQGNLIVNGSFNEGGGSYSNWSFHWNNLQHVAYPGGTNYGPWILSGGPNSNFNFYAGEDIGCEVSLELSQTVATIPGTVYEVNFLGLAVYDPQRPDNLVFGAFFGNSSVSVSLQGWQEYDFFTTATDATTTFDARIATDLGSEFGITGISITQVPEPGAVFLLGFGAAAILFYSVRQRDNA